MANESDYLLKIKICKLQDVFFAFVRDLISYKEKFYYITILLSRVVTTDIQNLKEYCQHDRLNFGP